MNTITRLFDFPYYQLENFPINDALATKQNGFGSKLLVKNMLINQESGHLTPRMKLKHIIVLEKYQHLFEKIYKLTKQNIMKTILISLVLIFFTGCQPFLKNNKSQISNVQQVDTNNKSNEFSNWVNAVNNKSVDAIKDFYLPESIKIISSGIKLNGPNEIAEFYALNSEGIKSISSLFIVNANKEKNIDYELIRYKTLNGKSYAQLLISRVKNGNKFREFEFVSEISKETNNNEKRITEKRNLWVELCNSHNPENLVKTIYSSNSIYFNHKPIIKGQEGLIKEYSYMKDENYKLTLHPLKMFFVNDNLVYEIGQCEGTYKGKYILVWKKESDGEWRVFIDSNI